MDHEGIIQEGLILEQLDRSGMSNVPSLLCHGDVHGQSTVTQTYWGSHNKNPLALKKHKHYRKVGRPLKSFKNGYELTLAIRIWLSGW